MEMLEREDESLLVLLEMLLDREPVTETVIHDPAVQYTDAE